MDWYYAEGDNRLGPVTQEQLHALIRQGRITGRTLVWNASMSDWTRLSEVISREAFSAGTAVRDGAQAGLLACCSECGRPFHQEEGVQYAGAAVCAGCKPKFFRRLRAGGHLAGDLVYAGFWIRFGAKLLDGIIQQIVNIMGGGVWLGLLMTVAGGADGDDMVVMAGAFLIPLMVQCAYITFFLGKFGATPGKMAARIEVVMADGSPITYGRAFGRFFAEMLSRLLLCIGYIMAAFDDEKQALHDRICGTRVIKRFV